MSQPHEAVVWPQRPTFSNLFLLCLKIGLLSFGGGLTGWVYREFVQKAKFLDDDDFASILAMSQMLPGANVINMVICIGEHLMGPIGSLVCFFGFIVGPFFALIGLLKLFEIYSDIQALPIFFSGVAYAAMGLLLLTCAQGVRRAMRVPPSLIVVAATAFCVGILRWPLIPVVIGMAPLSIFLAWRRIWHGHS